MPLLNYTTRIEAYKTVDQICRLLAKAGASQVMTDYSGGTAVGVSFGLAGHAYKLPVQVDRVEKVLSRDPNVESRYKGPVQAERVAWRIAKDWLEAQLAIVATEMVSFDQVMLPYMRSVEGKTIYELYLDGVLPALGPGGD